MKDYEFVIARYNEDISWLNPIIDKCTIINKYNNKDLPNVGRESDTYLWYIINNYYNLPDIIIFSQARISDHVKSNSHEFLLKLYNEAKLYGKSLPSTHHYWKNYFTNYIWGPKFDKRTLLYLYVKRRNPMLFYEWFMKFINPIYPDPIKIYKNGLFAVKKELILKHDINYYITLRNELQYDNNPIEGHYFERSWYYIFD